VWAQLTGGALWFNDLTAACVMFDPTSLPMGYAGFVLPLASFALSWHNLRAVSDVAEAQLGQRFGSILTVRPLNCAKLQKPHACRG
jgi:hypothetical protein